MEVSSPLWKAAYKNISPAAPTLILTLHVCLKPLSISGLLTGISEVVHLQTAMLKAQQYPEVFVSAWVGQV